MLAVREGSGAWGLGGPLPTSLPLPEGEAGSMRSGLWPHAPGALGWASPAEPETWAAATLRPLM